MRSIRYFAHLLSFCCITLVTEAIADQITLESSGAFSAIKNADEITVEGEYTIENAGNVLARAVFPAFRLGAWTFFGNPEDLATQGRYTWKLRERVSLTSLGCEKDSCGGLALPSEGIFPLEIQKHWQDGSSYKFSAPDVLPLMIGRLTEEQLEHVQVLPISAHLSFVGDGNNFRGKLRLLNHESQPEEVFVSFHTTRELLVQTRASSIRLPPGETVIEPIELENFRGLPESTYAVFAILQWEDRGMRNALATFGKVRVISTSKNAILVYGTTLLLVIVVVVIGVMSIIYWTERRRAESGDHVAGSTNAK